MKNIYVNNAEQQNICDQMLNTITDWIALFSYFEIVEHDSKSETCVQVARDVENDDLLRCLHKCLLEAQVIPGAGTGAGTGARTREMPRQRISMMHTAVLSFLYMSPRKTPSGKMLEMLYTEINSNARDVELRCLRAMTAFKDRQDDEMAYAQTLPIVLRSLRVSDVFGRSIDSVLRKQATEEETEVLSSCASSIKQNTRPLLRDLVLKSVSCRKKTEASCSWNTFKDQLNFPPTTSPNMQRLLYFIVVQESTPQRKFYESYYTKDMCDKALKVTLDIIDIDAIMKVVKSLRVYNNKIKSLIDFHGKCLVGLNQKTKNSLSIVQVLQLYIASYQPEQVRWECWKKIEKTMNHTIIDTVTNFISSHAYDVDGVLENLLYSQINDS